MNKNVYILENETGVTACCALVAVWKSYANNQLSVCLHALSFRNKLQQEEFPQSILDVSRYFFIVEHSSCNTKQRENII